MWAAVRRVATIMASAMPVSAENALDSEVTALGDDMVTAVMSV